MIMEHTHAACRPNCSHDKMRESGFYPNVMKTVLGHERFIESFSSILSSPCPLLKTFGSISDHVMLVAFELWTFSFFQRSKPNHNSGSHAMLGGTGLHQWHVSYGELCMCFACNERMIHMAGWPCMPFCFFCLLFWWCGTNFIELWQRHPGLLSSWFQRASQRTGNVISSWACNGWKMTILTCMMCIQAALYDMYPFLWFMGLYSSEIWIESNRIWLRPQFQVAVLPLGHAKWCGFQDFLDYVVGSYIHLTRELHITLCLGCFYCAFSQCICMIHRTSSYALPQENKIHKACGEAFDNQRACWEQESLLAENWINLVISMQPCWTSSISLSSFVVVIIIYDSFSGSTPTPFILEHFIWSWGSIIICNSHSYCNSSMENLRSSCSPTTSISASTSTSISASTSTSISASGQIQHQRQLLLPGHHQPVHGSKEFQMVWWHLAAQSTFDLIPKLWQKWLRPPVRSTTQNLWNSWGNS